MARSASPVIIHLFLKNLLPLLKSPRCLVELACLLPISICIASWSHLTVSLSITSYHRQGQARSSKRTHRTGVALLLLHPRPNQVEQTAARWEQPRQRPTSWRPAWTPCASSCSCSTPTSSRYVYREGGLGVGEGCGCLSWGNDRTEAARGSAPLAAFFDTGVNVV